MKNMLRRQVIVPESLWNKVQTIARRSRCSASAIVRQALESYLKEENMTPPSLPSFHLGAPSELKRKDYYDDRC